MVLDDVALALRECDVNPGSRCIGPARGGSGLLGQSVGRLDQGGEDAWCLTDFLPRP